MRLDVMCLNRFCRACLWLPIARITILISVAAGSCLSFEARAAVVQLGIMGDSLSYGDGSDYGENPNWHTQLENAGLVAIPPTGNQAFDGAATADLAAQSRRFWRSCKLSSSTTA